MPENLASHDGDCRARPFDLDLRFGELARLLIFYSAFH